ncbi:MAG: hypothetical protein R3C24_15965 [Cyanobacteriota/Melainabacteria group bacterium]
MTTPIFYSFILQKGFYSVSSFTDPDSPEFLAKMAELRSGVMGMSQIVRLVQSGEAATDLVVKVLQKKLESLVSSSEFEVFGSAGRKVARGSRTTGINCR